MRFLKMHGSTRSWAKQAAVAVAAHMAFGVALLAAAADDPGLTGSGAGVGGGSSSSNASNYQSGTQLSVSSRTGGVSIQAQIVELPGIVSDMSLTLAISYRSEDAVPNGESDVRYFGLPYGWRYNISFLDTGDQGGTVRNLYLAGNQSYVVDFDWRTQFTPAGADQPISVKTGLLQYNRGDAHFREDAASVSVGGIASSFVYSTLDGMSHYFSANGLELRMADRFGNHIDYFYDRDTNAREARVDKITDSWGNDVVFSYCEDSNCTAGEVTISLPDGRSVGFIASSQFAISEIIDAEGKRTHLNWIQSPCEHGQAVLAGMTSPSGGVTTLEYSCLNVCAQPSSTNCQSEGNSTTWPVASAVYECPNNESGTRCPDGSAGQDFLTTRHSYETGDDPRNYTGFPFYSPYAPTDPSSDALMSSNDTAYLYTTVTSTLSANGTVVYQKEDDYNFLHLQHEQRVRVRARQEGGGFGLSLSKEKSFCYSVSADDESCTLEADNYQNLPANYQAATRTGSCVYDVDRGTGMARRSVTTRAYDSFGNTVNSRTYHASDAAGVVSNCDRSTRLTTSGLRMVADDYAQFDTPAAPDSDLFLPLGNASGKYGVVLGQQSFFFLDEDEAGVHGALGDTEGPVLVKLACHTLTTGEGGETAGAHIKESTVGLMSNQTSPPTTAGIVDACESRSWDDSVAPPKTKSFSYDAVGRALSHSLAWAEGFDTPGGVSSSTGSIAYQLVAGLADEEPCGDGGSSAVLQTTTTDDEGNQTVNRVCTLNGFHLANVDARGNRTRFEHTLTGMVEKTTHPNGTFNLTEYYHVCPLSQDGRASTCPPSVSSDCPFDDASTKRNCMVESVHAGADPDSGDPHASFADGLTHVTLKDGLGRVTGTRDDVGADESGYTAMQTRDEKNYDSLGLISAASKRIGASEPLIYTATTTYGVKLRPVLVCGPRGDSQQIVHDDVNLGKLKLYNGSALETYAMNDSNKLTSIADCDLMARQTAAAGGCPTTATDLDAAECPGDAFFTHTLHDGAGQPHSITTAAGDDVSPGTTVSSSNGTATYSADMLKYGYAYTGGDGDQALTASSGWERDLHGQLLRQSLDITGQTASHTATSDTNEFNQIGLLVGEHNNLDPSLVEIYEHSPTGKLARNVSYEGVAFHHYYDSMDRPIRYCFASEGGGSEGEGFVLDPVTGSVLTIQHFTNPNECADCGEPSCPGDVAGDAVHYSYTRFGAVESIVYADELGAELQMGYDKYQRPVCFADAMATNNGSSCPASPVDDSFDPPASALLVTTSYWEDGDTHRRGLLRSKCRGIRDETGAFVERCMDTDYYTAVDTGGSCASELDGVVGAFAGQVKAELYCGGGSCLDGDGEIIYRTDYLYDDHRRPCSVESRNAAGALIRGTSFAYDQYDQVVSETHSSDLDPSDGSNYTVSYVYDGLLRLTEETHTDAEGELMVHTTYAYDARSNLIEKVEQRRATSNPGPDPTATPAESPSATAAATATATARQSATAVRTEPPTSSPTARVESADDESCSVGPASGAAWPLLIPVVVLLMLRRRRTDER